jgi:hypothetical protein
MYLEKLFQKEMYICGILGGFHSRHIFLRIYLLHKFIHLKSSLNFAFYVWLDMILTTIFAIMKYIVKSSLRLANRDLKNLFRPFFSIFA